jgi:hypothetical protein
VRGAAIVCYGGDVRRADSLPEQRAIDWLKAARCVKTKGERRAARARMDDMMACMLGFVVVVCKGSFAGCV